MTDKELRKLKRQELLEIIYYLRIELDDVRDENDRLKERLETRDKDYEHIMEGVANITEKLDAVCKKTGASVSKPVKTSYPAKPSSKRSNRRGKNG